MVITSHPLATRAAVGILCQGGNARDAALCASAVQTVVKPHMTTITGILSMLHYEAASGTITYTNGNMNAPLTPLPGFSAADLRTGRGVAVPGWWAGFEAAIERHGSRPKRELLEPAIRYARDGLEIHPFPWGEMFTQCHLLGLTPQGREIFMPDNLLPRPGDLLVQRRAAGAHFLRVMPRPGHRATTYVAPNIVFKNGKPVLASGSPSVGLLANIIQNTVNILDFGIPIEHSVVRPRFGGRSYTLPGHTMIEADADEAVRERVAAGGVPFEVVNPWNWHHGSFQGIWIDPTTGMMTACGDPRRCSRAEGVGDETVAG